MEFLVADHSDIWNYDLSACHISRIRRVDNVRLCIIFYILYSLLVVMYQVLLIYLVDFGCCSGNGSPMVMVVVVTNITKGVMSSGSNNDCDS